MSAKAAEQEFEKKNQNASSAEAPKQNQEVKEPSIQDFVKDLDPSKVKMAEKMGIPLTALINYMAYQEQKLNLVVASMPTDESIKNTLIDAAKEVRAQQAQQFQNLMQPQGQGGSPNYASFLPLIAQLVGGGGGGDNKLQELAMKALTNQINMSSAITNAVVTKVMGKATSEVAEEIST